MSTNNSTDSPPEPGAPRARGVHRVLVVGGYGYFGRRIVLGLRTVPGLEIIVAGRNAKAAARFAIPLGFEHRCVNATARNLVAVLRELAVDLVISAAGPFGPGEYRLAQAAIAVGAHYLDISDNRSHVCGVSVLDSAAKEAGVLVTSGVCSVPALSSAVIDHYAASFASLQRIEYGITTSELTPGIAAFESTLAYCGQPLVSQTWGDSRRYGWQDGKWQHFRQPLGWRWLVCCDIPDLALFPVRYAGVSEMVFRAGIANLVGMVGVWLLSWLVRAGLLRSAVPLAPTLHRIARALEWFGGGRSGMYVQLQGTDHKGRPLTREWQLIAEHNDGPQVPAMGVVALARKLAAQGPPRVGALPCMGMLSMDEYLAELEAHAVQFWDS